jgi:predicted metal-dependent hydrolase
MPETHIQVRRVAFDFEAGAGGPWNPRRLELTHTLNAFQIALPYVEPYFIDTVRQAASFLRSGTRVTDVAELAADARAFCAQEANHGRQHRLYSRLLRRRYPRLEAFEKAIERSLARSQREDSLARRLAYTAGFEAITAQLSRWMFRNAGEWFRGADPQFTAMMLWHGAEEIEHRHVAFDVLRAVDPSLSLRAWGLFAAIAKTDADTRPVVNYMLGVDGAGRDLASRARLLALRASTTSELVTAAARYLRPRYHPSQDPEPDGVRAWRAAYSA